MSIKLNASSGTYNVQASEMFKDFKPSAKLCRCRVHFLDDSEGNFEIEVSCHCFSYICCQIKCDLDSTYLWLLFHSGVA